MGAAAALGERFFEAFTALRDLRAADCARGGVLLPFDAAAALEERELVAALPDVHVMKRDRAILAINAFRAALAAATHVQTGEAA